jgi:hypothetical protein
MGFSLFAAMQGEEGRFFGPVLGGDHGVLGEYQAWLEERGDPRGAALRAQAALLAATDSREASARMRELQALVAEVDETWWRCVDRLGTIRACGRGGALPVVRFAFECPNKWEGLERTGEAERRWCGECRQSVYWCGTRSEAEAHARAGHCITVPAALARSVASDVTQCMTGRPDPVEAWGRRIWGER